MRLAGLWDLNIFKSFAVRLALLLLLLLVVIMHATKSCSSRDTNAIQRRSSYDLLKFYTSMDSWRLTQRCWDGMHIGQVASALAIIICAKEPAQAKLHARRETERTAQACRKVAKYRFVCECECSRYNAILLPLLFYCAQFKVLTSSERCAVVDDFVRSFAGKFGRT